MISLWERRINLKACRLRFVKLKLEGILNNVEVLFKGDEHSFILENCIIIAQDREIEVKDLKFKKGDSDIELNGKLPGFFIFDINRFWIKKRSINPTLWHNDLFF